MPAALPPAIGDEIHRAGAEVGAPFSAVHYFAAG
jgi:hypothetical protein